MKYSHMLVLLFLGGLLGLMMIGCEQDSLVGIQSEPTIGQEPDFVAMPKPEPGAPLSKLITDYEMITPEKGGQLRVAFGYNYYTTSGLRKQFQVMLSLTFPPYAVSDTIVAAMTVDDLVLRSRVDILFNPHGSTFLKPAYLDCIVNGMDVAGYAPTDQFYLYYYDNGTWVKMITRRIDFRYDQGALMCENGELPHFSRYAFGR